MQHVCSVFFLQNFTVSTVPRMNLVVAELLEIKQFIRSL